MKVLGQQHSIPQQTCLEESCMHSSPLRSGSTSRTEGLRHFLYIARAAVDRRLVDRPMALPLIDA